MDRQRVQLWASIAEIVSAVAVVISLLYVASEFRQAKTLTERDADAQLFERVSAANSILIENPDIAEIAIRAAQDPDQLSDADRLRYLAYQHQFFDSWELAWGYHADGVLGPETWKSWDDWFAIRARQAPRFAWNENRENFTGTEFRDHVDRALKMESTAAVEADSAR